jgi:hypothetical protein
MPSVLTLRRADARPIAVVRILVGLAAIGNAFEQWAALNRLLAPLVVKMPYLPWLPYPPAAAVPALIGAWLIAALLFMVGFRTRVAGGILVALLAYVLLLDQQLYSNHLYLNVLVVLLVTVADSGARYSLDAHYTGRRDRIAEWPLLLLKIQVSIVYFFAALTKVNRSYLSGDLMLGFIHADVLKLLPSGLPVMGVVQALAIASVAVEFFLAFALWFAGWRWLALAAGLALHLSIILTGGTMVGVPDIPFTVFALLVMAPYILFFQLPAPRPAAAPSNG